MVDDAHASGVMGKNGRGTPVPLRVDATGRRSRSARCRRPWAPSAATSPAAKLISYLTSVARPFMFSSSMPPSVVGHVLGRPGRDARGAERIEKLWSNAKHLKEGLKKLGFDTGASETPITPVMVGDTKKAQAFSARLFEEGVFALSICFPIVGRGKDRLRNTIVSSGHTPADLDFSLEKFGKVGRELGII